MWVCPSEEVFVTTKSFAKHERPKLSFKCVKHSFQKLRNFENYFRINSARVYTQYKRKDGKNSP